jgi:hypothetical protein
MHPHLRAFLSYHYNILICEDIDSAKRRYFLKNAGLTTGIDENNLNSALIK